MQTSIGMEVLEEGELIEEIRYFHIYPGENCNSEQSQRFLFRSDSSASIIVLQTSRHQRFGDSWPFTVQRAPYKKEEAGKSNRDSWILDTTSFYISLATHYTLSLLPEKIYVRTYKKLGPFFERLCSSLRTLTQFRTVYTIYFAAFNGKGSCFLGHISSVFSFKTQSLWVSFALSTFSPSIFDGTLDLTQVYKFFCNRSNCCSINCGECFPFKGVNKGGRGSAKVYVLHCAYNYYYGRKSKEMWECHSLIPSDS